jgi:hypothetical protein
MATGSFSLRIPNKLALMAVHKHKADSRSICKLRPFTSVQHSSLGFVPITSVTSPILQQILEAYIEVGSDIFFIDRKYMYYTLINYHHIFIYISKLLKAKSVLVQNTFEVIKKKKRRINTKLVLVVN